MKHKMKYKSYEDAIEHIINLNYELMRLIGKKGDYSIQVIRLKESINVAIEEALKIKRLESNQ